MVSPLPALFSSERSWLGLYTQTQLILQWLKKPVRKFSHTTLVLRGILSLRLFPRPPTGTFDNQFSYLRLSLPGCLGKSTSVHCVYWLKLLYRLLPLPVTLPKSPTLWRISRLRHRSSYLRRSSPQLPKPSNPISRTAYQLPRSTLAACGRSCKSRSRHLSCPRSPMNRSAHSTKRAHHRPALPRSPAGLLIRLRRVQRCDQTKPTASTHQKSTQTPILSFRSPAFRPATLRLQQKRVEMLGTDTSMKISPRKTSPRSYGTFAISFSACTVGSSGSYSLSICRFSSMRWSKVGFLRTKLGQSLSETFARLS
jgi:hypothetical protein